MKVLVDTNVILDVLLKREPFCKDSFVIFQLADSGHIEGVLAAVSMTNVFYLLRKARKDTDEVYQIMETLKTLFSVAAITDVTVSKALSLRWKDFEDAVQFITAKENNVDYILQPGTNFPKTLKDQRRNGNLKKEGTSKWVERNLNTFVYYSRNRQSLPHMKKQRCWQKQKN